MKNKKYSYDDVVKLYVEFCAEFSKQHDVQVDVIFNSRFSENWTIIMTKPDEDGECDCATDEAVAAFEQAVEKWQTEKDISDELLIIAFIHSSAGKQYLNNDS